MHGKLSLAETERLEAENKYRFQIDYLLKKCDSYESIIANINQESNARINELESTCEQLREQHGVEMMNIGMERQNFLAIKSTLENSICTLENDVKEQF